jgi:CelD/BcsL family acetyltransferase involved in cellulose biosynthesis
MMEVNSWLTGRRGISLPFTDECAPLCADADSFCRLFREVQEHAGARAWKYLEFRGGRPWFGDAPASASFFGHHLHLDAGETALWSGVRGAVRQAVRKAEQSSLTVEFSQDLGAVKDFFRLLCQTRRRHGLPVQPFRFFESIHRHVLSRDEGWVVLARQGKVPVAGAVFFHFGKTAIYKFGASNETFQKLRANNLVMWEAIKWHSRRGFGLLDFGRTSMKNEGLRRYKLGWGTQERRIDYFRYDRRKAGFVTARDRSSGWHNRIFRMLPISLSRLIGAAAYRHVA